MAVGLAMGMGFVALGLVFTIIVAAANIIYVLSPLGRPKAPKKTLKITVPESIEFEGLFDEVLDRLTVEHEFTEVSTTNIGGLFQLEYAVRLDSDASEKQLIDEIRCRNGKPQGISYSCCHPSLWHAVGTWVKEE